MNHPAPEGIRSALTAPALEPIAIVGMACRFPQSPDIDHFWRNLIEGRDCITDIPEDAWDNAQFYREDRGGAAGYTSTRWGGFIQDPKGFDASFFGISPREASYLDPQQRHLLELAWQAIEHAGMAPSELRQSPTGVFVGASTWDFNKICNRDMNIMVPYVSTGTILSIIANRISYVFDLKGPSLVVDTACSSSLVAVHMACQSLRSGECEQALVGGVNLVLSPEANMVFSAGGFMSSTGRCKTFSQDADGYVRSEGAAMVLLMPLSKALAHRHHVLGLIRGSAINQNGQSNGLTAPNGLSQQAVLRQALAMAGASPADVSYIEAHGTGTPLGDPIEVRAIKAVYEHEAAPSCTLGAVKSTIGHCEAAAGLAGLIKVLLMFKHRQIPPVLHLRSTNQLIEKALNGSRFTIAQQPAEWASSQARVAGVSSFGVGGTNAHMILEEFDANTVQADMLEEQPSPALPRLLKVTARSGRSLGLIAHAYAKYLDEVGLGEDFLYTANVDRDNHPYRRTLFFTSEGQLIKQLTDLASQPQALSPVPSRRHCGFLFAGQGSQYHGMGRALYAQHRIFAQVIDECHAIAEPLGRSIKTLLFDAPDDVLKNTAHCQPALFCLEYALARLWMSWGMQPRGLMGHSLGEYVACCLAQVFSLEDALKLVIARSTLMEQLPDSGQMLVVMSSRATVDSLVQSVRQSAGPEHALTLAIAADNNDRNVTVSGCATGLQALSAQLLAQGIHHVPLEVSHAFHSPLMQPMVDAFRQCAEQIQYRAPTLPIVANVTGELAQPDTFCADYFCRHILQPVEFRRSLDALKALPLDLAIEVGPSTTLTGICQGLDGLDVVPSLSRQRPHQLWLSLSQLYEHGLPIDWRAVMHTAHAPDQPRPRTAPIPVYVFDHQTYWPSFSDDPVIIAPIDGPQKGIAFSRLLSTSPLALGLDAKTSAAGQPRAQGSSGAPAHPAIQTLDDVQTLLGSIIAKSLSISTALVAPDASFKELGLTSVLATELLGQIQTAFAVKVTPGELFDHPSLSQLAGHVFSKRQGGVTTPVADQAPISAATTKAHVQDERGPQPEVRDIELDIHGYAVNVCEWGPIDGPVAVLVHGIHEQGYAWQPVATQLAKVGYRVIAPDLRGHGLSSHAERGKGYLLIDYVSDLILTLSALNISAIEILAGHSLGSLICAIHASLNSPKIGHLHLIETFLPDGCDHLNMSRQITQELDFLHRHPKHPIIHSVDHAVQLMRTGYPTIDPAFAATLCARTLKATEDGKYTWRWDYRLRSQVGMRFHGLQQQYIDLLRQIACPVSLSFGANSDYSDQADRALIAQATRAAEVLTLPGGHNIHLDFPQALFGQLSKRDMRDARPA